MNKKVRIYGWAELNGAAYCTTSYVDADSVKVVNEKTGEVNCSDIMYGKWFKSFSAAKKGTIIEL